MARPPVVLRSPEDRHLEAERLGGWAEKAFESLPEDPVRVPVRRAPPLGHRSR